MRLSKIVWNSRHDSVSFQELWRSRTLSTCMACCWIKITNNDLEGMENLKVSIWTWTLSSRGYKRWSRPSCIGWYIRCSRYWLLQMECSSRWLKFYIPRWQPQARIWSEDAFWMIKKAYGRKWLALSLSQAKVSLIADSLSSTAYNGYMVITAAWINSALNLHCATLDSKRFLALHTGENTCALLNDVFTSWELASSWKGVTTDNTAAMILAIRNLRVELNVLIPVDSHGNS